MAFLTTTRQVAGNRSMLRLELGWFTALAAESAYLVSLLVFAYEIGGVVATGLVAMVRSLPAGVLAPILTALADRFPRARVLLAVHLSRAVLVSVVAVTAAAGLPPAIAIAAAVGEGLLLGLHRATTLSFMPALARSPEELLGGNAAITLGEGLGVLVGPVSAGVLLMLGGTPLGLAVPAAAFVVAAAIVLSIEVVAPRRQAGDPEAEPASRVQALLVGVRALRDHPSAGLVVGLFGSQTFVRGALMVLVVATAVQLLELGESGVGYLTSAIGAGGLAGAALAMTIAVGHRLALPFSVSLALWGLPIAFIGLLPVPPLAFVLLGMVGAANATLDVSGFTLLQRSVPNRVRGRVFGALEGVAAIGMASGAAVAPLLVQVLGLPLALVAVGALLPVLAIVTFPLVRRADSAAIVPHRELSLLRRIPMFAPLPLTMIEQLAGSLEPVGFEAGERIIEQGEPGECFYVIGSGSVDVIHDERHVATLAEGDGFGEIALLSDRPRTASVVAREPVEAFRLVRPAFLEAVTGSATSAEAADRLMAKRLSELGHHE